MNQQIEKLREQYMQNPPEGMTARDIKEMSDEALLDMDYFLHEKVFIFSKPALSFCVAHFSVGIFYRS